jgi:ribosomal protein S11
MIAGRHAPEFQVILLFKDLTAFEGQRKRNQTDAAFQKFAAKLASISREPVSIELFEVLVVMPGTDTSAPQRPAAARAGAKRKAK